MSDNHEDVETLNHLLRATLKRKELARDEFDYEDIDACELVSRALERAIAAIEREAGIQRATGTFLTFLSMLEAEAELSETTLDDSGVVSSFMGCGASHQLTIGDLRNLRAALSRTGDKS